MITNYFQNKTLGKILIVVAIAYLIFAAWMIWRSSSVAIDGHRYFTLFDDAMISMRYADNLVHGHGLVFNLGERVEGFTNPLLVFIMAGTIGVFGKVGGVLAIQIFGLLLLAADIWFIVKIAATLLPKNQFYDWALFFTGLLSLTFYPLLYWSIMGMETGLLTTLVLTAMYLIVTEPANSRSNVRLAVILGLCYLTRPDSVLFIGIVYLFRLFKKVRSRRDLFDLLLEALLTSLPIIGYQIFRLAYYGSAVPNTFILKATGILLAARVQNGLLFIWPFVRQFEGLLAVAIVGLIVLVSHGHRSLRSRLDALFMSNRSHVLLLFSLFTAYLLYQVVIGGDPWPPYWRFMVPYIITFFIGLMVVAAAAAALLKISHPRFTVLFTVLILVELLYAGKAYVYDLLINRRPYQSHANDANVNTALAIRELTTESATVAPFWAGTIPYYSERYTVDPLGKIDPHIAALPADVSGAVAWGGMITVPGHNKYDLNYSFKQLQPDVIQYIGSMCTWGQQNLKRWCDVHYQLVEYKGVQMLLKKGSQNVYWDKLK